MRTQAYRNLNKPGCIYSIRQSGRVVGYSDFVVLADARFKHANANALHRIRSGPREVCAWIGGTLMEDRPSIADMRRFASDPKKTDYFADAITGHRIDNASLVVLTSSGAFYRP
jgi:hypothetical protein